MINQRTLRQHRRKNSQFHPMSAGSKTKPKRKTKIPKQKNSGKAPKNFVSGKSLSFQDVHSLIQKSMSKVAKKHVIVQDLEQLPKDSESQQFFRFGKGAAKDVNIKMPPMQQIEEVPDTGSYSQRNTQGKQNNRNGFNRKEEAEMRQMKLSLQKIDEKKDEKSALSHRLINNGSKRSQSKSKSSRSHNCSQSTVQLVRPKTSKSKSKQRINIKKNTSRVLQMQKQIKMIWQCVGDLWQTSRVTKKISEENSMYISQLISRSHAQERDLIELKLGYEGKVRNA